MTLHELPLVRKDDGDGYPRWVTPQGVIIRGSFKHNPHHPFRVTVFDARETFEKWNGADTGHHVPAEGVGQLSATAVVISNPPAPRPDVIVNAVKGDVLRTPIGDYEIRDDWALHDPYLVKV